MDLLAEILSSRIRAEIFRLLFGVRDEELHMREIERQSGAAIGTVQTELKKLLRLDLVKKRRSGNRLYFRANEAHLLYRDINSLVLKTRGLVDILKQAFREQVSVKWAFVFGSIARNEERSDSDLDLMIIGALGLREASRLISGLADQIGREINPHVMSLTEFKRRKENQDHFLTRVLAEPKIFFIGDPHEFEEMV